MALSHEPHLFLVRPRTDQETVKALFQLLKDAQDGKITGLAYIALHRGSDYSANAVGDTRKTPVFTLGVLRLLESKLESLMK